MVDDELEIWIELEIEIEIEFEIELEIRILQRHNNKQSQTILQVPMQQKQCSNELQNVEAEEVMNDKRVSCSNQLKFGLESISWIPCNKCKGFNPFVCITGLTSY